MCFVSVVYVYLSVYVGACISVCVCVCKTGSRYAAFGVDMNMSVCIRCCHSL